MPSSLQTEIFERIDDYRAWRLDARPLVGFVPTMGALHAGHAALIERARAECQQVVVSIFVNPLQFGPNEDYAKYPRVFDADVRLCRQAGVDVILHPAVEGMYPAGMQETTRVIPPAQLISGLCARIRPGHFEGVATVVMKLFGIVEPHAAYFGEKDFQQLAVIKRMAADLNLGCRVVGVPTVREADGLALSSRNVYLNAEQRKLAPRLHAALMLVKNETTAGRLSVPEALKQARHELESVPGLTLQYLEFCHVGTLQPAENPETPFVILVAAKLGDVRLIDNVVG